MLRRSRRTALGTWLTVATVLGAAAAHATPRREELVPGHVVVRFREPRFPIADARLERPLWDGIHLLHAVDDSEAGTEALVARLRRDPNVDWVEREHVRYRDGTAPNDPLFKTQWSLPMIHLPEAWLRTEGSTNVVVAVVDTGIIPHPDLVSRYAGGYDFISNDVSAGDGDGRDPDPTDMGTSDEVSSALHGTHVTGILAAHVNNDLGIAGVDWNCRILPVRVLGVQSGSGTDTDIADGIRWAAGIAVFNTPPNEYPADVINLSFGGPGLSSVLQAAIDAATAHGSIIVASAGNDASDTSAYSPAGQNHVIAVGAVDTTGARASYSNDGPRVDIMAPGGDLSQMINGTMGGIVSTMKTPMAGYTYVMYNGTSQAAPHISGVVSLMRGAAPTLRYDTALAILQGTAQTQFQCAEGCGAGLVDADQAVQAAIQVSGCDPACPASQLCLDGVCVDLTGPTNVIGGYRGCALDGGARSGGAGGLALALLGVLALACYRRRRRV